MGQAVSAEAMKTKEEFFHVLGALKEKFESVEMSKIDDNDNSISFM